MTPHEELHGAGDSQEKSENSLERVTAKIAELFTRDIEEIFSHLEHVGCIVAGVYGSGKSMYVAQGLASRAQLEGCDVLNIDAQRSWRDTLLQGLYPDSKKGLLIIDEATEIPLFESGEVSATNLVGVAVEKGYAVVPIISYAVGEQMKKATTIAFWSEAFQKVTGKEVAIIDLGIRELPEDLAREFLEALNKSRSKMSPEILTYILSRIPRNLRMLDNITSVHLQSTKEAAFALYSYASKWVGMTTQEELDEMERKCFEDFQKLKQLGRE